MKKSSNVWFVAILLALSVGMICYLSGQKNQASQASAPSGQAPQQQLAAAPAITPDLTKVDPHEFLDPVPVGHKAPDFSIKDALGKSVKLSQFQGKKNVVLIFYQGSFCSVCGHQLSNLQSHLKDFQTQDAAILAISADDAAHAQQSIAEHGLSFTVIPDPKKDLIKSFGIPNVSKQGIAWPSAFVVDKKGIVRLSVADPQGKRLHSDELLPVLSKLTGKPAPKLGYED